MAPRPRSATRSPPACSTDDQGPIDAHHPHREDLDERRRSSRGTTPASTSSPTRSTTAWACSRGSAPTRPTRAQACSASPTTSSGSSASAQILGMEIPYSVDELVQATKDTVASHGPARLLRPPDRLLRLRRDGAQHAAVHGRRVDRLLAVGRLPRRRRPHQGRAHEDQQLDPPRPQHDAAGVEDHRQLRQLQPGQGRGPQGGLRRGAPAQPAGVRGGVHRREHLRGPPRPAHHAAAVGRRPRGHHPGHGDPAGQGHGLRGRSSGSSPAATSTSPTRCSSSAPPPR